jgi:hypothetical protein
MLLINVNYSYITTDLSIMPPRIICVDGTVDGKKAGSDNGMFLTIGDTDERTYHELLLAFLKNKSLGNASVALLSGSIVVLRCVEMMDARLHGGRPSADVGLIQDGTVFLSFYATLVIAEVPTQKLSFIVRGLYKPAFHRQTSWFS